MNKPLFNPCFIILSLLTSLHPSPEGFSHFLLQLVLSAEGTWLYFVQVVGRLAETNYTLCTLVIATSLTRSIVWSMKPIISGKAISRSDIFSLRLYSQLEPLNSPISSEDHSLRKMECESRRLTLLCYCWENLTELMRHSSYYFQQLLSLTCWTLLAQCRRSWVIII